LLPPPPHDDHEITPAEDRAAMVARHSDAAVGSRTPDCCKALVRRARDHVQEPGFGVIRVDVVR
jgi:hypothetical protein